MSVALYVMHKKKFIDFKKLSVSASLICTLAIAIVIVGIFGQREILINVNEINLDAYDGEYSPRDIMENWTEVKKEGQIEGSGECRYKHVIYQNPDPGLYGDDVMQFQMHIDIKTGKPFLYGYIEKDEDLLTDQEQNIGYTFAFSSKHKKFILVSPNVRIIRDCNPEEIK